MIEREAFDDQHRRAVCKIGRGVDSCRYLTLGTAGWDCERNTAMGLILDHKAESGEMIAQGKNCEGVRPRKLV